MSVVRDCGSKPWPCYRADCVNPSCVRHHRVWATQVVPEETGGRASTDMPSPASIARIMAERTGEPSTVIVPPGGSIPIGPSYAALVGALRALLVWVRLIDLQGEDDEDRELHSEDVARAEALLAAFSDEGDNQP